LSYLQASQTPLPLRIASRSMVTYSGTKHGLKEWTIMIQVAPKSPWIVPGFSGYSQAGASPYLKYAFLTRSTLLRRAAMASEYRRRLRS
jgi:hypothetical protein